MKRRLYAAAAITAALLATPLSSMAQSLQVDINSTNSGSGPTQSGWSPWLIDLSFSGPLNESQSFAFASATAGNLTATLATTTNGGGRDYGLGNVDQSGGVLILPDVWSDLAFFNNDASGTMTLTLENLAAGAYQFTSYSYANNLGGSPGTADSGIADVSVDTGAGFVDSGLDVTMGANASLTTEFLESECTVTLQFTVANDDDPVIIRYDGLAANGGDSFGINGFELAPSGPDNTPPTLIATSPTNAATGIATGTSLVATFDGTVLATSGDITIHRGADGSLVETIDVNTVEIVGAKVTITPSTFDHEADYYVNIDEGAFTDLAGNPFAGIDDAMTWEFRTAPPPFVGGLQVDFNSANGGAGPNQTGWQPWQIDQSFDTVLDETMTFAFANAVGGMVQARLVTGSNAGGRSYGIADVTDPENLNFPDVWADQVFFNNDPSGTMTLTLGGLLAGSYQLVSYHYANNLAGLPGTEDAGIADVSIDSGGGFVDTGMDATFLNGTGSPGFADLGTTATLSLPFEIANDNDPISILYDGLATNGGDTFGINGFQVAALAPPPPFEIVAFTYSPIDNTVGLTWDSRATETYIVRYSTDNRIWEGDLGDDIDADPGETTTRMFDLVTAGVAGSSRLFFRIEKQ